MLYKCVWVYLLTERRREKKRRRIIKKEDNRRKEDETGKRDTRFLQFGPRLGWHQR